MNRERAKELLPVIQAFADGQDIQARAKVDIDWSDIDSPLWAHGSEYRIKTKPREYYINIGANAPVIIPAMSIDFDYREQGKHMIKVREVID